MLTGLNHITLAVNKLERSLIFYVDLLGFTIVTTWQQGAYLSLGDLWLCLIVEPTSYSNDYSHIAFSISQKDFSAFCQKLLHANIKTWQENQSEGDSLYILDPDSHKLEIHVGSLETRLKAMS